jgi:hypothetical protein
MWLIILLGLSYSLLGLIGNTRAGASSLWYLDPILLGVFALGFFVRDRLPLRRFSACVGAFIYIAGVWLTSMLYELSLRTGETGFGGMHPETMTSFILAQGFYIPFAFGGWWLARRHAYSFRDVFWTGALSSLYEMITVGEAAVLNSPNLLVVAPLLAGYYLTVYGLLLAMPLLFNDEKTLWQAAPRIIPAWRKVIWGILLGLLCWVTFVGWAALVE